MSYPPPPPPLNYAPYGGPPKKNRAGLVIVLLIGVVVACVGAAGYIAYDLASSRDKEPKATEQADTTPVAPPSAKPTPRPSVSKPVVKPSVKPTVKPPPVEPKPPLSKPQQAAALARTFVAHLNANRPEAASALACVATKDFVPNLIGTLVGPPTSLTVGRATEAPSLVVFQLSGSTKGKPATGILMIRIAEKPCVQLVQVTTF